MTDRLQQSLNYIEDHLDTPLCLDQVAAAAHLSSYHFARLFRSMLGRAPMEYVRLRRLTEAALLLRRELGCEPGREPEISILELAQRFGFESHQGFTNAFKREFHIPPVLYRERPFALPIQEKIILSEHSPKIPADPVRQTHDAITVAGLIMSCTNENKVEIPQLWSKFAPWFGSVPGQQGSTTYGVCIPQGEGDFHYIAGVAVTPGTTLPPELTSVEIPAGCYAVFTHLGSLDFLQETIGHVFGTWVPQTGDVQVGQPDFERYDHRFDPVTSSGEMEYWVPVKTAT